MLSTGENASGSRVLYAGLPTELPKGSIHACRVEFEARIGNEALCVQVNHSDDSAPAGHFTMSCWLTIVGVKIWV